MSATTEPSTDLLLALCCECGSTRTVSRRASGTGGNRPLRCDACHKTTPHAAIGAERAGDWREMLNHEKKLTLSVDDQLDLLRSFGVKIRSERAPGLYASVGRWIDEPQWVVYVNLTAEDKQELASVMTQIVDHVIRPDDQMWFVRTDDDGRTFLTVEWVAKRAQA